MPENQELDQKLYIFLNKLIAAPHGIVCIYCEKIRDREEVIVTDQICAKPPLTRMVNA